MAITGKASSFINFEEHTGNNAGNGMKKTSKQRTVFKKEFAGFFVYGKNTVSVLNIDEFKRHFPSQPFWDEEYI